MQDQAPVMGLTFFTLIAGIVIAAGAFLYFLKSSRNRHIAAQAVLGKDAHGPGPAPDGAGVDLIGLVVIALVVMGLLTLGYSTR